jgi:hypothetical protein
MEFETMVPVFERSKAVDPTDSAVTKVGSIIQIIQTPELPSCAFAQLRLLKPNIHTRVLFICDVVDKMAST